MIDIAENCLIKIADALQQHNVTIRILYQNEIVTEEIEGQKIELLSPLSFLEGIKALELNDFSELEIACLMNILAKPQLDNAILVDELVQIFENFGIMEEGNEEIIEEQQQHEEVD